MIEGTLFGLLTGVVLLHQRRRNAVSESELSVGRTERPRGFSGEGDLPFEQRDFRVRGYRSCACRARDSVPSIETYPICQYKRYDADTIVQGGMGF